MSRAARTPCKIAYVTLHCSGSHSVALSLRHTACKRTHPKLSSWLTPRRKSPYGNSPFAVSDLCPPRGILCPAWPWSVILSCDKCTLSQLKRPRRSTDCAIKCDCCRQSPCGQKSHAVPKPLSE